MEVMMLGLWKNVEELEASISLDELEAFLKASRDKEHRQNKFAAALKGINIDEGNADDVKKKFDEIKRRAEARTTGKSETALEMDTFGLDVEVVN